MAKTNKNSNDDLLNALNKVKKRSEFFRNSSYQGSSASTESFIASGRYLCNNVKKEAKKEFYKKVIAAPTRFIKADVIKNEVNIVPYDIKFLNSGETDTVFDNCPELREDIKVASEMLNNIEKEVNSVNWKSIANTFKICQELLNDVRVDGKRINKNYDDYVNIVNDIANRV